MYRNFLKVFWGGGGGGVKKRQKKLIISRTDEPDCRQFNFKFNLKGTPSQITNFSVEEFLYDLEAVKEDPNVGFSRIGLEGQ
jgi:hypothetical protein